MAIHPTAIVDPDANMARDAEIGPYCIIGSGVSIGSRTRLLAHVYLEGKLTIGKDNLFYPYCSCGVTPQDKKYKGETSETRVGDGNTIREFVTINRGTEGGGMVTAIGDGNLLMAYVHVATMSSFITVQSSAMGLRLPATSRSKITQISVV